MGNAKPLPVVPAQNGSPKPGSSSVGSQGGPGINIHYDATFPLGGGQPQGSAGF
jgi:hypothetical protein